MTIAFQPGVCVFSGAPGLGTVDDTAILQRELNSLLPGQVLALRIGGDYQVKELKHPNTAFTGMVCMGRATLKMRAAGSFIIADANYVDSVAAAAEHRIWQNIDFDGDGKADYCWIGQSYYTEWVGCHFKNAKQPGTCATSTQADGSTTLASDCPEMYFHRCRWTSNAGGGHKTVGVKITDMSFFDCVLQYNHTNYFTDPFAPVTKTLSLPAGRFSVRVGGTGSVQVSGGRGTARNNETGRSVWFELSAPTSVTFTVVGSVTFCFVCTGYSFSIDQGAGLKIMGCQEYGFSALGIDIGGAGYGTLLSGNIIGGELRINSLVYEADAPTLRGQGAMLVGNAFYSRVNVNYASVSGRRGLMTMKANQFVVEDACVHVTTNDAEAVIVSQSDTYFSADPFEWAAPGTTAGVIHVENGWSTQGKFRINSPPEGFSGVLMNGPITSLQLTKALTTGTSTAFVVRANVASMLNARADIKVRVRCSNTYSGPAIQQLHAEYDIMYARIDGADTVVNTQTEVYDRAAGSGISCAVGSPSHSGTTGTHVVDWTFTVTHSTPVGAAKMMIDVEDLGGIGCSLVSVT